jgi:hypothetical protein
MLAYWATPAIRGSVARSSRVTHDSRCELSKTGRRVRGPRIVSVGSAALIVIIPAHSARVTMHRLVYITDPNMS